MKLTESQLRQVIREVIKEYASLRDLPRKRREEIKDAVAEYVKGRVHQYTTILSISVKEDAEFPVQWDSEIAFKVTLKNLSGYERFRVIYDVEKNRVVGGHKL